MRTLGIDLAAQDGDTAYCAIEWVSQMALPEVPVLKASDETLIEQMREADWTGIDAPFGWPDDFVDAVSGYSASGQWPKATTPTRMRHRETDRFVHEVVEEQVGVKLWPLSVSSDRIAVCAWRCARLLRLHAQDNGWTFDRVGVPLTSGMDGPPDQQRGSAMVAPRGVVEVYPAAALALWGLTHKGYKHGGGNLMAERNRRREIVGGLEAQAGGWLVISADVRDACVANDDCLDALVASLVACAAATDRTYKPTVVQRGEAQREGWIHLPSPDSITGLAPGGP
jgi:predicted nuclease with RNAse H fold